MAKVRAHVLIEGRVQGVFFRSYTCHQAEKLDVAGWVRNCPNGRVEAVFEGEEDKVRRIVDWCHIGPPEAHVRNVDVRWEDYTGEFDSFYIRYY